MSAKIKVPNRILSIILCIALLASYIPFSVVTTANVPNPSQWVRSADISTMDSWKDYYPTGNNKNTENAGGVWMDKSVFTKDGVDALGTDSVFNTLNIAPNDENFLVALSAIASNMTIAGKTAVPTDTMLVLDLSGSMNGETGNNDVASELVAATNISVQALLDANANNRVGVVLYSGPRYEGSSDGDDAVVALPLGRYTTSDANGRYFDYSDGDSETISLNTNVYKEGTTSKPTYVEKDVVGATYIQNGLEMAKDQFLAVTDTSITGEADTVIKRKPIVVLLSDGAPTLGDTDFTNVGGSDLGDGTSSSAAIGFVTQLTAAYTKQQIEEHYKNDSLFYSLGVGIKSSMANYNVAEYILNPKSTTNNSAANAIRSFWDRYNDPENDSVTVQSYFFYNWTVDIIDEPLEEYYVDKYFDTASYGTDLKTALSKAFEDIVSNIEQQSEYLPTFVETSEHSSGFVTFVDKIGKYMEVTDIKGISVNDNLLFSGQEFAKALNDGAFGTVANPTELGDNFVWAAAERLGIADTADVRALIGVAYENGQIAYDEDTEEYSNYIGWCADENGAFLGPWYEGMSDSTIPADTKYIVKSYGYLGTLGKDSVVRSSDMLYAVVQVREEIATGEQQVTFGIPASLVPVITYDVEVNELGECVNITTEGAKAPMRLIYEVALDSRINEYTIAEIVDEEYLEANTVNGNVNFYTNQFEASTGFDPDTGKMSVNTYSYFKPSLENDRYYFQNDSRIYSDADVPYTSANVSPKDAHDAGVTLYRKHLIYTQTGADTFENTIKYAVLSDAILEDAKFVDGEWIIEGGHIRLNYGNYDIEKEDLTLTGTLPYANQPFVDAGDPDQDYTVTSYTAGATLGNNGKLSVPAKTGIKISKTMADGVTAPSKDFTFTITTADSDNTTYNAYRVSADGTGTSETVSFSNGVATNVKVKAGESLYIEGISSGRTFSVVEVIDAEYKVDTVKVDGTAISGTVASLTVVENKFASAEFVNTTRSVGALTIAKTVTHPFETSYTVPSDMEFTMEVTLKLGESPLAGKSYNNNTITTDSNGKVVGNITLKHGEKVEIYGLPDGAVATVKEINTPDGFTASYWDNGELGDGTVIIVADDVAQVIVVNDYTPDAVYANVSLEVTKDLQGRDEWLETDSYTFEFQRRNAENTAWDTISSKSIDKDTTDKTIDFTNEFKALSHDTAKRYYYRVIEIEPEQNPVLGVSYDKAIHSFYVDVTDTDMDGELEIASVASQNTATTVVSGNAQSGYSIAITFTNVYAVDATNATIEIQKTVENFSNSPLGTLDGFEFKIYESDADGNVGNLIAETNQPPLTSVAGVTRTSIRYSEKGTYYYAIREVDQDKAGWEYSTTTVYVTVVVTDNGQGQLVAVAYEGLEDAPSNVSNSVTIGNKEGSKFINTYKPKMAALDLEFVNKTLNGRDYVANEFEFEISGYEYNLIDSEGMDIEGNKIFGKNGTPDDNGDSKVIFTPNKLYFDEVGTYYHLIKEIDTGKGGIHYDTYIARVTVNVTDNNGVLEASYDVVSAVGDEVNFVNTYTAVPTEKAITGTKNLIGRHLINAEFTFYMKEAVDAQGNLKTDGAVYEAKNTEDKTITFPTITYDKAGTYYYVVSEKLPEEGSDTFGLDYDEREYIVTLVITDDGVGNLKAGEPTYTIKGASAADEIVFNNTYAAAPTDWTILGDKTITGRVWNDDTFSFTVYNSNSDWTWSPETKRQTVQNDANGLFTFDEIEFETAGSYYFVVNEENAGQVIDGITYDTTEYRIRIDVVDNFRGTLTPNIYIFDGNDIPQIGVSFINTYAVTGTDTVILEGEKTLTGRDLEDEEFVFELYETEDDNYDITGITPETTVNADGRFKFELTFDNEDIGQTFYYVVSEEFGGSTLGSITYDDTKYFVEITVEDDLKGGVKTIATINGGNTISVNELDFTNHFKAETGITVNATKVVQNVGTEKITPEGFEFILEREGTDKKFTATSNADGEITFDIKYTQEDIGNVYNYTLSEVNTGKEHVVYSDAKYHFTVTVDINDDYILTATITQGDDVVENIEAEFVNVYDYTHIPETGDTNNIQLWIVLLFVGGGLLMTVTLFGRKRKDREAD